MARPDVTLQDIRTAQARIGEHVWRTPVLESTWLNEACGARLYFKCENLQHTGAFKARGATNAIFARSSAQLRSGVVTHSSGNHGAAVARAAQLRGVPARVVMPHNSSAAKLSAVRAYGGEITLCAPTLAAREAAAAQIVAATHAVFIHPYDDAEVIAGQGTVALEFLEQVPPLQWLLCPIGGGGLASGIAIAVHGLRPDVRVVAVEPATADDAYRSFESGTLAAPVPTSTVADGLRGALSERTFTIIRQHLHAIVTVDEQAIVQAMRELWRTLRIIIEPSAAVPYAAIAQRKLAVGDAHVGIVLTGGNVDIDALPW
ncbi:MAG TPA: pyridoxal-phosphate dependent enzyme [Steroidobacteraceae bacterium]|jgi:threonine dehydratase